jgi:hypothetical protein
MLEEPETPACLFQKSAFTAAPLHISGGENVLLLAAQRPVLTNLRGNPINLRDDTTTPWSISTNSHAKTKKKNSRLPVRRSQEALYENCGNRKTRRSSPFPRLQRGSLAQIRSGTKFPSFPTVTLV